MSSQPAAAVAKSARGPCDLACRRPSLKIAAAAWIYAGGAHHTSYSRALTFEHLEDFAEIAGIELLRIGKDTTLEQFRKELRWNETSYWMNSASGH